LLDQLKIGSGRVRSYQVARLCFRRSATHSDLTRPDPHNGPANF
jgi:hypothetical protein